MLKQGVPVHVGIPVVLLLAVVEVVATLEPVVIVATAPTIIVDVVALTRLVWGAGSIVCNREDGR